MLRFSEVHNRDPRLVRLTWSFNDLGGSNGNILIRNLLVVSLYDSAAIVISCGKGCQLAPTDYQWIALIELNIMTTIQVQQRCDQKSDAARRRTRIPLVLGDGFMRWTIEAGAMGWSIGAATFRKADIKAYALALLVGETLSHWYMRCRKSMRTYLYCLYDRNCDYCNFELKELLSSPNMYLGLSCLAWRASCSDLTMRFQQMQYFSDAGTIADIRA